jgi:hypothetical protein
MIDATSRPSPLAHRAAWLSADPRLRYRLAVAETRARGDESTADAPKPSRKQQREQKRRLHEAQKKARAIGKANDRRARAGEKKDQRDMDKAAKKADKGKQQKADKKTDKVRRRQAKRR